MGSQVSDTAVRLLYVRVYVCVYLVCVCVYLVCVCVHTHTHRPEDVPLKEEAALWGLLWNQP